MTVRRFGTTIIPPVTGDTGAMLRRKINAVLTSGTGGQTTGVYKMRGWDIASLQFYHWTTGTPSAAPPPGYPSPLQDIVITAIFVDPVS